MAGFESAWHIDRAGVRPDMSRVALSVCYETISKSNSATISSAFSRRIL